MFNDAQVLHLAHSAEELMRPIIPIGPEWEIIWKIDRTEEATGRGQAEIQSSYRRAYITILPVNGPERLVQTVVHELCHVGHWMFNHYANLIDSCVPASAEKIDEVAWKNACEIYVAMQMSTPHVRAIIKQLERESLPPVEPLTIFGVPARE